MVARSSLLVIVVAVVVLVVPPAALATFPGRDGHIAFAAAGGWEEGPSFRAIGHIRPSGAGELLLRGCTSLVRFRDDCTPDYGNPSYSPDGRRIAFDAGARLAVVRADGETIRFLAPWTANDGEPAFSPDGRRLVFSGGPVPDAIPDVYVTDLRTGATRRIATDAAQPAWSARGVIAYVHGGAIYLRRPGGAPRRLTEGTQPDWSPGGRRLVFVRTQGIKSHLYLIRADGTGLRRIRPRGDGLSDDSVAAPVWSPSGRRIAYYEPESGIRAIRPDGRRWQIVAEGMYGDSGWHDYLTPSWQPRR